MPPSIHPEETNQTTTTPPTTAAAAKSIPPTLIDAPAAPDIEVADAEAAEPLAEAEDEPVAFAPELAAVCTPYRHISFRQVSNTGTHTEFATAVALAAADEALGVALSPHALAADLTSSP